VAVPLRILAIDANPRALRVARTGNYRTGPRDAASNWSAPDSLRQVVRFEQASLTSESAAMGRRFDIIFCRNVLIYFQRDDVPELVSRLARELVPGGAIVVSPADAVLPMPGCVAWSGASGWLTLFDDARGDIPGAT
jgi:chemotaxis methyl-accepting protein methylase